MVGFIANYFLNNRDNWFTGDASIKLQGIQHMIIIEKWVELIELRGFS